MNYCFISRKFAFRRLILAAAVSLAAISTFAYTDGDWEYSYSDSDFTATLTKYNGSATTVTVPSKVSRTVTYQEKDDDGEWHTRHRTYTYTVTATSGTFSGNTQVTSVVLPSSVTTIGSSTFSGCTSLYSTPILSGITTIGSYAFQGCTGLKTISTPSSLTSLGICAFSGCTGLTQARIDGHDLSVSYYVFQNCTGLKSVVIGDGVTNLQTGYWEGWSVTYSSPFSGCNALETVEVGTGVTAVQEYLFYKLPALREVTFHGNVASIGRYAFYECQNLVGLVASGTLGQVGYFAFYNCRSLASIPDLSACSEIGYYAFYNCSSLDLDLRLTACRTIGDNAFYGCSNINSLSLPNVEQIGSYAFQGCTELPSITTPSSLAALGSYAFSGCTGLTQARIDGHDLSVSYYVFQNCTGLKSVVIGDGVTNLQTGYWEGWSVTYYSPFSGCNALETVELGTGVTTVQEYLFYKLPALREVTFHGNVASVGRYAFYKCPNLARFSSAGRLGQIGEYAFYNCGSLASMPDISGCSGIGNFAFYDCRVLAFGDLSLPDVTTIGYNVFYNCQGLASIQFSQGLASIGSYAFQGCTSLMNVWLKGSPPSVGSYAFSGVAPGARGHYPRSLASEWLPQIDSNGRWNGLIMHELSQPILSVKSANPAEGSITLAWDDGTDGQCVSSYSIYRSANDTFTEADKVDSGITDTEWTDTGYWNAEPVLSPLNYWVVAESDYFDLPESNAVETRHRYGLSVGIGQYGDSDLVNNVGFAMDANLCRNLALSQGGFSRFREFLDSDATSTPVTNEMATLAQLAIPGDMVMLFISAHGAEGMISLFGNTKYTTSQIQTDVGAFNSGVTVVGIIMACHSGSLLQLGSWPSNAALISSCAAKQISIIFGGGDVIPSPFGGILLQDGWADGYADRSLFGTSWDGGNGDGVVSFDELARYVTEFSKGYSDMVASSSVQVTNRRLLKHAIAGRAGNGASFVRPLPPTSCEATHGFSDAEIQVTWAQVADPTIRRYWLFRKKLGDARAACISRYAGSGSFSDAKSIEQTTLPKELNIPSSRLAPENFVEYQYHVCSVNPCGISDPSPIATGMSGTVNLQQWYSSLGYTTSAEIASARTSMASNGNNTIEECYVTGISPNDETAKFEARIEIGADGKPIVSWEPDLNEGGTKSERVYRVLGAKSLGASAEWDDITDIAAPDAEGYRFFKVSVELP